ncbi:hypothetical protein [Enterococcus phage vB_Efs10_KEN05]
MGKGFESSTGALHNSSVGLYRSDSQNVTCFYMV